MSNIGYKKEEKSLVTNDNGSLTVFRDKSYYDNELLQKVSKETGKGLSSNDYSLTEKNKLSGIQPGATVNDTDVNLKNRANHSGMQLASTISDFATSVRTAVLTGITFASTVALAATDTVLVAFGKLQAQLNLKAPLDSPVFTGLPVAPTPSATTDSNQLANTAYVQSVVKLKEQLISSGGTKNNQAITGGRTLRFTAVDLIVILTGLTAGVDGDVVVVINATNTPLELKNQSNLSLVNNRLSIPGSRDLIINPASHAYFRYSGTATKWELTSLTGTDFLYRLGVSTDSKVIESIPGGYVQEVSSTEYEVELPSQVTALTSLALDGMYPEAMIGFQVTCPLLRKVYKKFSDTWKESALYTNV